MTARERQTEKEKEGDRECVAVCIKNNPPRQLEPPNFSKRRIFQDETKLCIPKNGYHFPDSLCGTDEATIFVEEDGQTGSSLNGGRRSLDHGCNLRGQFTPSPRPWKMIRYFHLIRNPSCLFPSPSWRGKWTALSGPLPLPVDMRRDGILPTSKLDDERERNRNRERH